MPLLTSLFPASRRSIENPSTPLSSGDDWMYEALGAVKASSGVNVNRETALTYAAWWRGVNLISRDVAKLPVHVYRKGSEGKQRDTDHPAYYLLRRQPNRDMTPFHFRQTMMSHVLAEGNGYAYIDRAGDASPLELIPLLPYRTYPVRVKGRIWYVTALNTGEERKIPAEDILHIKGLSFDGLVGYSVIRKARESLGLGMAFDTFGSVVFRNGTTKRVVLKHPGRLSPEAKKNLRESWERLNVGLENAHKTAILEENMEAQEMGMSAKDAQLLDERKFQIREVALWFGVPPHKLGDMESASYNSLEQENQAYLDSAIDPWLVNWEQECDAKLLTERQRKRDTHVIEFDRRALVRGDMGQRTAYYSAMIGIGVMNRDEARAEEGYNPIPDGSGQQYLVPLNMGKADGGDSPAPDKTPASTQTPGALLELPDVRQQFPYDCGAAATMSVCQYFGVGPATEADYITALGTTPDAGTRPSAILDFIARQGLIATAAANLDLDALRHFWAAGQPVICPIQDYGDPDGDAADQDGHYVVVMGCSLGYVFIQDPSADNALDGSGSDAAPGRVMIPEDRWLDLWHDTDALGQSYYRYGIAVGKELLPGGTQGEPLDTAADEAEGAPGENITPTKQPAATGGTSDTPLSGASPAL